MFSFFKKKKEDNKPELEEVALDIVEDIQEEVLEDTIIQETTSSEDYANPVELEEEIIEKEEKKQEEKKVSFLEL